MKLTELEINIEGYSGPFDLLCSLVESRKFQLTGIKISQLIKIYGLYLIQTRQAPADTLAEFFYMSSGLLLEKTRSLLPGNEEPSDDNTEHEEEFIRTLERYMPYRKLYLWLADKLKAQSLVFRRRNEILNPQNKFVIKSEDANIIAEAWKNVCGRQTRIESEEEELHESESNADWDGFTESDDQQIDARVSELEEMLMTNKFLSFNELCSASSKHNIVITLLAMLELCRMGKVSIEQEELFSDVRVITKT